MTTLVYVPWAGMLPIAPSPPSGAQHGPLCCLAFSAMRTFALCQKWPLATLVFVLSMMPCFANTVRANPQHSSTSAAFSCKDIGTRIHGGDWRPLGRRMLHKSLVPVRKHTNEVSVGPAIIVPAPLINEIVSSCELIIH